MAAINKDGKELGDIRESLRRYCRATLSRANRLLGLVEHQEDAVVLGAQSARETRVHR